MEALEDDGEYDLVNPNSGKAVQRLKAREVFGLIVRKAWENGEPGIVFIDRINAGKPAEESGHSSRAPIPAASSRCFPTNRATWAPST